MHAPGYGWGVDAIGCEEGEDIPFPPFPYGLEAFAKVNGCAFDLGVGVGSAGVGVSVYYYSQVSNDVATFGEE